MQQESGPQYLKRLAQQYDMANRVLPTLPEDEFSKIRREQGRKEIGVESFLMDFAIGAETRRRNIERWATGRAITSASAEHATAVINALPAYTTASPEALGAMRVERAKRFRLDVVVEDILAEVAQRLPRTIDAYRYHQDYAHDTLTVPSIGEIKVAMHETGDGIFRTIGTVDSDLFRVWNCRDSGVKYMDRYNDISRPHDVEVKPLATKVELYDDTSGIFVTRQGKRFTNSRVYTAQGRGYDSDSQRDDLHRTYDGPNPDAPSYRDANKGWREDKTVLSFRQTEDEMIMWLAENVLNPLRRAPRPESQFTTLPEEEPFPEGKVGPLYTFVREEDLRRIALIKDNPSKAYPDERKAVGVGYRLLSLGTPLRGASKVAYDGFVWCGVGEMDQEKASEPDMEIGRNYKHTDFLSREGVAVIKLKTATDVYVVDWQARVDLRAQLSAKAEAEGRDKFTNEEVGEIEVAAAKTLVPITEYNGGYKSPIVLIGRDLELDEVEAVYLPPQDRR